MEILGVMMMMDGLVINVTTMNTPMTMLLKRVS